MSHLVTTCSLQPLLVYRRERHLGERLGIHKASQQPLDFRELGALCALPRTLLLLEARDARVERLEVRAQIDELPLLV